MRWLNCKRLTSAINSQRQLVKARSSRCYQSKRLFNSLAAPTQVTRSTKASSPRRTLKTAASCCYVRPVLSNPGQAT